MSDGATRTRLADVSSASWVKRTLRDALLRASASTKLASFSLEMRFKRLPGLLRMSCFKRCRAPLRPWLRFGPIWPSRLYGAGKCLLEMPHRHTYKPGSTAPVGRKLGFDCRNPGGLRLGSRRRATRNIGIRFARALYGHPESGAIWEKHLASILEELGWARVPSHPGTWVHDKSKALLAVYVDDLLMTAPPEQQKSL